MAQLRENEIQRICFSVHEANAVRQLVAGSIATYERGAWGRDGRGLFTFR
jgi:hypothetical protein